MIQWLRVKLFGTRSNKREMALFAFMVWAVWVTFALWATYRGADMAAMVPVLSAMGVVVVPTLVGAAIYHQAGRNSNQENDQ